MVKRARRNAAPLRSKTKQQPCSETHFGDECNAIECVPSFSSRDQLITYYIYHVYLVRCVETSTAPDRNPIVFELHVRRTNPDVGRVGPPHRFYPRVIARWGGRRFSRVESATCARNGWNMRDARLRVLATVVRTKGAISMPIRIPSNTARNLIQVFTGKMTSPISRDYLLAYLSSFCLRFRRWVRRITHGITYVSFLTQARWKHVCRCRITREDWIAKFPLLLIFYYNGNIVFSSVSVMLFSCRIV